MPSNKSKKAAARQAQLSGRSRRNRPRGPVQVPGATSGASSQQQGTPPSAQQSAVATAERPQAAMQASRQSAASRGPRARARGLPVQPPETYFGREMRRIGIVFGVVSVALAVLTVVLR